MLRKMEEFKRTAYLREFVSTRQCELMFMLNVEIDKVGLLKEEVKAVRQVTDTVGSLLQHIINKIQKSIKTIRENKNDCENDKVEINVALKNCQTGKKLKPKTVLKKLISSDKNIEFSIFDQKFNVLINAPLVKEIKLPVVLYSNFTVQPSRLHVIFAENNKCKFMWYRSQDKENWTEVANTFRYKISDDDIDCYLKLICVPCNSVLSGPPVEIISENKVELMGDLPICPFEERHKYTKERLSERKIRIVSYNVLSNRYTESNEQFPYCAPKVLAMDYRKQLITKEILGYQADIVCLQEVDSNLYISYYKDIFKNEGYLSYYHKKGNRIPEGLACFFNKSRFKKVTDHQITYSDEIKRPRFTYLWKLIKENADIKDCFMKQMTSLHITVLKMKISNENHFIIVANTHLFYHPDAELIRILQVNIATTYIFSLYREFSAGGQNNVNVIFCGDFNCVPTSAVYNYMISGKISKTHAIFKNIVNSIDLFHNFQLISACGLPKYTNYTQDFKDCLDYIFVEKNKIKVDNVVPFPKEEQLAMYEGLPNEVFPSDHLALIVDLELGKS